MSLTPLLIQLSDFAAYVSLSQSYEPTELDPKIRSAQDTDLKGILGDTFYTALIADAPGFAVYGDLVNGVTYTNGDNENVRYEGLKPVLVFYTYARILAQGNTQHTPFNFVEKTSPWQNSVSSKTLQMQIGQAHTDATSFAKAMVKFLNWKKSQNASGYTIWDDCRTVKSRHRIRIGKIGD